MYWQQLRKEVKHLEKTINIILIVIILVLIAICIIHFILKKNYMMDEDIQINNYSLDNVVKAVQESMNQLLRARVEDLNLNRLETEKLKQKKSELRENRRKAATGDIGAKIYVKDYISDILQKKLKINELTIDYVIQFSESKKLTSRDCFDILLHLYKKQYGLDAFEYFMTENGFDQLRNEEYIVTKDDIKQLYKEKVKTLSFTDKLDILTQRIYSTTDGNGVVDDIRDMHIDGVSGGVSGIPEDTINYTELSDDSDISYAHDSVWVLFHGKSIHLECLSFGSARELERVTKNIIRYNSPGQLSESKGHIENDMRDGSRVVAVRPPFAETWGFFVRKHQNSTSLCIEEKINDTHNEYPIGVLEYMVRGCQVFCITGTQGCGKTTLLKCLIKYISKTFNIRIQEQIFELSLRKIYPGRNSLTFQETPTVSGQEGLDTQKKTDGDVNILGEIATTAVANWFIQMSQVASRMTICTHHAKTTPDLVVWMRDALLKDGGLSNERAAEQEVVSCINFDVHMELNGSHRYIERITEIIPIDEQGNEKTYYTNDIVVFNEDTQSYELISRISEKREKEILKNLTDENKARFKEFFANIPRRTRG